MSLLAPLYRWEKRGTPTWARSFMPGDQRQREKVASMKLIPIPGLIRGKRIVFCDDSVVRGTQLGKIIADGDCSHEIRR